MGNIPKSSFVMIFLLVIFFPPIMGNISRPWFFFRGNHFFLFGLKSDDDFGSPLKNWQGKLPTISSQTDDDYMCRAGSKKNIPCSPNVCSTLSTIYHPAFRHTVTWQVNVRWLTGVVTPLNTRPDFEMPCGIIIGQRFVPNLLQYPPPIRAPFEFPSSQKF